MFALEKFDCGACCWWCGGAANSREHRYKKSDIVAEFGRGPYHGASAPVRVAGGEIVDHIQGPASNEFKFERTLCHDCNTARSGPIDLAYDELVAHFRENQKRIRPTACIDLRHVFRNDWEEKILNVRRYFVKHACCRMADTKVRIGSELIEFLNGVQTTVPFFCQAGMHLDVLETLYSGNENPGSLWLGALCIISQKDTGRPKRLMSHYGIGYLRFNWTYDVAGDEWQDNMSGPVISLWEIRTLAHQPRHR